MRDELRSRRRRGYRPRPGRARQDACSNMTASASSRCAARARSRSASTRCRSKAATEYAGEDADVALAPVARASSRGMTAREGRRASTRLVDRPLVAVIGADGAARRQGRPRYLASLSADVRARDRRRWRKRSTQRPAGPFTIGSPQQLGDVLFDQMGLKGGRKGKSGALFDRRDRAGAAGGARA